MVSFNLNLSLQLTWPATHSKSYLFVALLIIYLIFHFTSMIFPDIAKTIIAKIVMVSPRQPLNIIEHLTEGRKENPFSVCVLI